MLPSWLWWAAKLETATLRGETGPLLSNHTRVCNSKWLCIPLDLQHSTTVLAPGTDILEDSFSADRRWGEWFRDDSSTLHLLLYFQSNAISDLIGGTGPQSGCVKAHPFDSPLDVQLNTGSKLVRQAGHEWVFLGSADRIHTRATAMKVMTLISLHHLSLF